MNKNNNLPNGYKFVGSYKRFVESGWAEVYSSVNKNE
jgi:hypothetical protein